MSQPATVLPELYEQLDRIEELSPGEREELRRGLMQATWARDPDIRGFACNGLADLARIQLDLEGALSWQRKAALLCPSDHAMLNNLGVTLLALDRPEEAIEPLLQAAELTREQSWAVLLNLSRAFSLLGDQEGALDMFDRAQQLVTHGERYEWLALANGAAEIGLASEALMRAGGMSLTSAEASRFRALVRLLEQRAALASQPAMVFAEDPAGDESALETFEATRLMRGRASREVLGRKDG